MEKDLGKDHDCNIWNRLWKLRDTGLQRNEKDGEKCEEWTTAANQSLNWARKEQSVLGVIQVLRIKGTATKNTHTDVCLLIVQYFNSFLWITFRDSRFSSIKKSNHDWMKNKTLGSSSTKWRINFENILLQY